MSTFLIRDRKSFKMWESETTFNKVCIYYVWIKVEKKLAMGYLPIDGKTCTRFPQFWN